MKSRGIAPSNAIQVANWFVNRFHRDARRPTIMELIKLTYISHGWHLEIYNAPLFEDRIEAWQFGPVIPSVYRAFKSQGLDITSPIPRVPEITDDNVIRLLDQVYDIYGHFTGLQLSDLTHVPGGPWHVTMEVGGQFQRIPDSVIRPHYVEKRERLNERAHAGG